jgi:prophage regulatory protein
METTSRKIIDSKEVDRRVPRSRVQRWRDIKAGKFPVPIEIGPNKLGWFEDEVDAWMASRPRRTYGAESEATKEYETAEIARRHGEHKLTKAAAQGVKAHKVKADEIESARRYRERKSAAE